MITNIELYLKENIDNELTIKKWPNENNFSFYLWKKIYVFAEYSHNKLRFICYSVTLLSFFAEFH